MHRDPRLMVPIADMVYGNCFDAFNKTIQEIIELENLVGSPRDMGPLGKRGRVGSVGCDTNAIGIQKIDQ